MSTPNGHRNNQLNICALPNSLKGPKKILDMADRHISKDGPFRILGNALTYLHKQQICASRSWLRIGIITAEHTWLW